MVKAQSDDIVVFNYDSIARYNPSIDESIMSSRDEFGIYYRIFGYEFLDGPLPPGQQYATCIVCGGPASMGIVPPNKNSLPKTHNGSYIFPNGVVVLVGDDVKAYLDGTLIFNYSYVVFPNNSILPYILKREEDALYR